MKITDILNESIDQDIHVKLDTNTNILNKLCSKFDILVNTHGYETALKIVKPLIPNDLSDDWYIDAVSQNSVKIKKSFDKYKVARNKLFEKIKYGI